MAPPGMQRKPLHNTKGRAASLQLNKNKKRKRDSYSLDGAEGDDAGKADEGMSQAAIIDPAEVKKRKQEVSLASVGQELRRNACGPAPGR